MTKYIDATEKEIKKTVFTHYLCTSRGWVDTSEITDFFEKVLYLGKCSSDGDMFSAIDEQMTIYIFKGTKGDEF